MRQYRTAKAAEEKGKHRIYKNYRASKVYEEEKAKNNAYMKSYKAKCKNNIQSCTKCKNNIQSRIAKFHEVASQGPLYMCTCWDQLWYNHSVVCVDKLRQLNPDIDKYHKC